MNKQYKINISVDALEDIKSIKGYLLAQFKYREYADHFLSKIKQSIQTINIFPKAYEKTGYIIGGLDVYFKPCGTYLIFFVVDSMTITVLRVLKDRMYWNSIMEQMQKRLTTADACDTIERKKAE